MYEITQQINIHVTEAPTIPDTGIGYGVAQLGGFISQNSMLISCIIAVLVLLALVLFLSGKNRAKFKLGITAVAMMLLSILACQIIVPVSADSSLTLDSDELDVTIVKPELSTTASDAITMPDDVLRHHYTAILDNISDGRIEIELNGAAIDEIGALLAENSTSMAYTLDYIISITDDLPVGDYTATVTHSIIDRTESFLFTVDTRMTDTLDTDPTHYSGTATTFAIPTSSYLGSRAYNWIINWGDGTAEQVVSGTSSETSYGISHNYAVAGEYQIIIEPVLANNGWLDAFGFAGSPYSGANAQANRNMIKSIDSPFTNSSRSGGYRRFAYLLNGAKNAVGIPEDLFSLIRISQTDLSYMFYFTFYNYAYNSTSAAIPASLFDFIDTSNASNTSNMFYNTFSYYAYNSTLADIPPGLFDSIDTSSATNMSSMFQGTFQDYARNSPDAVIPDRLFDSIDTSSVTNISFMFRGTFGNYALNSLSATIPPGLFDSIDTSGVLNVSGLFYNTFNMFAYYSISSTIPPGLFDSIDTSSATNVSSLFGGVFAYYAENSTIATIPPGLFDSIDTSNATNMSGLFAGAFNSYAYKSSAVIIIPTGLFNSISTSQATDVSSMFSSTFTDCAYNSTTAVIPAGLFNFLDLSSATSFASLFSNTFNDFAYSNPTPATDINSIFSSANFAGKVTSANVSGTNGVLRWTFRNVRSLTGTAQTFIDGKLDGIIPSASNQTFRGTSVTDLALLDANWR